MYKESDNINTCDKNDKQEVIPSIVEYIQNLYKIRSQFEKINKG